MSEVRSRLVEISLRDITPNPFRDFSMAPLMPEKVQELRESIGRTGFWENVLVRILPDGTPQLIYGHHRIEAARLELGEDVRVRLVVRELDDATLFKMMVDENRERWRNDARSDLAAVASLVQGYGEGGLSLPSPPKRTKKSDLRYAPSFRKGGDDSGTSRNDHPYTARSIADFMGWDQDRAGDLLNALELIEREVLTAEDFEGLSHAQARRVTISARRLLEEDPEVATGVARITASGFRSGDMSYRDAADRLAGALKVRSGRDFDSPKKEPEESPDPSPGLPPLESPSYRPYPFDKPSLYVDEARYFLDTVKAARPVVVHSSPEDRARIKAVHEELEMALAELDRLLPGRVAA